MGGVVQRSGLNLDVIIYLVLEDFCCKVKIDKLRVSFILIFKFSLCHEYNFYEFNF